MMNMRSKSFYFLFIIHHSSFRISVDEAGDEARAEAVVYVDDRDVRRAGVEHAEQGGDAAEARAVADAGGDGDDRRGDQPADDRRERALHPGGDDEDARRAQALALGHDAVDAGDARVPDPLDAVAHRLGRERGLLGDGDVARAGGDDHHGAGAALRSVAHDADHARLSVPLGLRADVADFAECALVRARDEHVRGAARERLDDLDPLRARLPRPEDDLGEALPRGPRVVDARVPDVLEVQVRDAPRRLALVEFAAFEGAQQPNYVLC